MQLCCLRKSVIIFCCFLLHITVGYSPHRLFADSKTLVYSWASNVGPLNPHLYSPNQMFAQAMVYEPLVRYTKDGDITPCLAKSWAISADGKEYVFHLRKNVVFSDGAPFNASAVKMNHDALLANKKKHSWLEMVNQIQQTIVLDPHTIKVILKDSYYPLLQDLALIRPFRYLSPSAFPASGNTADGIKAAIGTGPWILAESKLGEYDIFIRNNRYWGHQPDIERIVVKVLPDPTTRAIAFETGEVDLIFGDGQINLDTYNRFRSMPRYNTYISQPLATRTVALNTNRGLTRELAVRRAIQHAVNKEAIISGVFLETEVKADALYPSNIPYADLGLEPYRYNVAKAKQILESAGWHKKEGSSFRSKGETELSVDLCFVGNNAVMKSVAEVLQANLQKVGIKINLIGEEPDSFYRRQHEGDFDMIFNDSWGPPYDPHSFLSSWRVPTHADYQAQLGLPMKKQIDRSIGQVLVTTDKNKRHTLYRSILGTIHSQAVYLPISYTTGLIVHGEKLKNVFYGATKYEVPFEYFKLE